MQKRVFSVVFILFTLITSFCVFWWAGSDRDKTDSSVVESLDTNFQNSTVHEMIDEDVFAPDGQPRGVNWPENALQEELLLTFEDAEAVESYLDALSDAGFEDVNRLDRFNVLRVPVAAIRRVPPEQYRAEADFSYRVVRPTPPVQVGPSVTGSLRGFERTALEIAGGSLPKGGEDVLIAVLDSGLSDHPYFDSVPSVRELDLVGSLLPDGAAQHGSAVASIAVGRDGVAPDASLLSIRVLDAQGEGTVFDVAKGIVEAVDYGAKVINLSLGVYADSPVLRQAVQYAQAEGVVLVAAGGNDGYGTLAYPAAYEGVLSVTSIDRDGNQAGFPNQSTDLDFAAPGVSILAVNEELGKGLFSGTSASAPFVSGAVAAMLAEHPERTSSDLVTWMHELLNEAGAPGGDPLYGHGVLDWDRLREREGSDVADIALASIYLSSEAIPGTTMPIEFVIQNRGNRWLSSGRLNYKIGDEAIQELTLGSLRPGELTSRKVFTQIPSVFTGGAVEVVGRVSLTSETDRRPENDYMGASFRPRVVK